MKQRDFLKFGILILGVTAIAFFVFLLTSRLFIEAFCFASGCGLMCLLQWCAEQKCKDDNLCCDGLREGREFRYARLYRPPYDAELGSKSREGFKRGYGERPAKLSSCCECQCEKKEDEKKLNSSKESKAEPKKTKSKSRKSSKSSSRKRSRKTKKERRKKLSA